MKKFRYKARNWEGKQAKGYVEATSINSAVATLRSNNLIVVNLVEIGTDPVSNFFSSMQKVSFKDVINFTRQLATMVGAGLPLTEALASLQDQSRPAMAAVIADVLNNVRGGITLFDALSRHPKVFPKVYLALVKSGETAGMLDKVLVKLADNLEKRNSFIARVKGAMIYPIIVVVAMIVVGFIMMVLVIPKMLSMYQQMEAELPLPTQILIAFSDFATAFWWLILLIVGALGYSFSMWRSTPSGRQTIDRFIFRIPVIGVLQEKVIMTDITRTLAMLIGTGVSIIEGLAIVSETTNNVVVEAAIKASAKEVEKGVPLATAFGRYEFFPPIVSQMMAVGEETGKLNEVLEKVSTHFEEESDLATKALTTAIEPLMIIMLGLGVGFLVVAIILPIYNLTSQF